jgi:hypothetical protein
MCLSQEASLFDIRSRRTHRLRHSFSQTVVAAPMESTEVGQFIHPLCQVSVFVPQTLPLRNLNDLVQIRLVWESQTRGRPLTQDLRSQQQSDLLFDSLTTNQRLLHHLLHSTFSSEESLVAGLDQRTRRLRQQLQVNQFRDKKQRAELTVCAIFF